MTRIWYDTEFLENGRTIDLISIGMVTEDGREYYAVNANMPIGRIQQHKWLCENVLPHLPLMGSLQSAGPGRGTEYVFALDTSAPEVKPKPVIANEVRDFILAMPEPSLWAWYAAYDHVALCQLWGPMIALPKGVPMWTNDLKQECERLGNPQVPQQESGEHNALEDARHNRVIDEFLTGLRQART